MEPVRYQSLIALWAGLVLFGCGSEPETNSAETSASSAPATEPREIAFAGAASCKECHTEEHEAWEDSHHSLAMQEVSESTVLGDFENTSFIHFGQETRFSRDGERFLVTTDGPRGEMETYEIAYVFGVYPLQQYLVAFPGGRLQALQVCWDSRPEEEGGQRWYHLYEEPIPHTDVLHWTKEHFGWNYMCADCHSTELSKNFDPETNSYHTTWRELDVSCESCHGPGQDHVDWARRVADKPEPEGGYQHGSMGLARVLKEKEEGFWALDPGNLQPKRTPALASNIQVESCAPCHSHRQLVAHPWRHAETELYQTHSPSIMDQVLYHDDGQIKEEVYVYGSFVQSKMFHHGVRCTDCHDPHTLKLRLPDNALCIQCHSGKPYNTEAHHHHDPAGAGGSCIDCHMPGKYYMGVDWRRDHSFRVPRPDIAEQFGTPDSCTSCHEKDEEPKDQSWSAKAFLEWYGDRLGEISVHPGLELARARSGIPDAEALLTKLARDQTEVPGILRATAIADLGLTLNPSTLPTVRAGLSDPDPAVRRASVVAFSALPPGERIRDLAPLLADPTRAVRVETARLLAAVRSRLVGEVAQHFEAAKEELFASLRAVQDRASGHMGEAIVLADLGDLAGAEKAYRLAGKIGPDHIPSRINLSELLQQQNRPGDALVVLEEAALIDPKSSFVQDALGRTQVRQKNYDQALVHLANAARLAPEDARIQFFYGVALNSLNRPEEAFPVLIKAHELAPRHLEYLQGIVSIARDHGRWQLVIDYGNKLLELSPNPQIEALVREAARRLR